MLWAVFAVCAGPAPAAGLRPAAALSAEQAVNPVPAPGDILLPMPCGLHMAFRAVEVPARGFLRDAPFSPGTAAPEEGRSRYDRRFASAVAAPFGPADLPEAWRPALREDAGIPLVYYLMGKYELSGLQWRAVMDPVCPSGPPTPEDVRPKTGISWYDAQDFARRYTEWLLAEAPENLPRFAGDERNVGFVRLPTEAEWEYAARGGARVLRETLEQDAFPLPDAEARLADYAVYRPEGAAARYERPLPVGSRRPNPLGLHDTAGNAAEMVFDLFRFSLGGRLHGSAGGFVRKGGSFSGGEPEIMPGRREEMPFFTRRGPASASDLGVRFVLSGINTPGGERDEILNAEWDALGRERADAGRADTPLQAVDGLLAAGTADRAALKRLREMLKAETIVAERRNTAAAEGLVRTALYMSETVRNYAVRFSIARSRTAEIRGMLDKASETGLKPDDIALLQKTLARFEQAGKEQFASLETAVNFYRSRIEESAQFDPAVMDYNIGLVSNELTQETLLGRNMRDNLAVFVRHLHLFREGDAAALRQERLIRDILPDNLEADMPLR